MDSLISCVNLAAIFSYNWINLAAIFSYNWVNSTLTVSQPISLGTLQILWL